MDVATKIEKEKLALLESLDSAFGSVTIKSIASLVDGIDSLLQDHLRRCLLRHAQHFFLANRINEESQTFCVGGIRHELEIVPSARKNGCLSVRLMPRDLNLNRADARLRKRLEIKLEGSGRYSSVVFDLSKLSPISNQDLLTTLTRDVFVVGHNWMNKKTMSCIREASDEVNKALYEHMRTVVPNQVLMNGFVFSVLLDERDFVLVEEEATRRAMSLSASSAWTLGRSPADITIQVMTQVIPMVDSVIVDAVKSDKTLDFSLTADKYYQADDSFSESMRAVWGSSMSCFPIMREGKMLLVAFFPTAFRNHLEPILVVHRQHLEQMAKPSIGRIKKTLQTLAQVCPSNWAEAFGRITGAFAAAYVKVMQNP